MSANFPILILVLILFRCSKTLELCSFDGGTCSWSIEPPWNVVSLAILPRREGLVTAPSVITSEGPFLVAQGKFATVHTARVISQSLQKSDHMRILAYRYQRRGDASLRIFLKNATNEILLDTISQNELERSKWHRRSVIFPPIASDDSAHIIFECDNIRTAEDVIAVDEVDVATPANVMWSGQDSKLFDEEDIRSRETRRSSKKLSKVCSPLSCQFRGSACSWQLQNLQMLPNKIVNEAEGASSLTSLPVQLPDEPAFFQIQIFDSQGSASSLKYRHIGSMEEKEIWTNKDEKGAELGWKSIRIELGVVPRGIPLVFILSSMGGVKDFVAFSSTELVDEKGKVLSCEQSAIPVQSQSSNHAMVRLTALQNLKMSPIESLLYQPPISTTPPLFSPTPPPLSFNHDEPVAVLPIAPAHVSARGIPIVPITSFSAPLLPLNIPKLPFL